MRVRECAMDEERDNRSDMLTRTHGAWSWLIGAALTAAALYWAVPLGGGRPTSVTIFGLNAPQARIASYPGLRMRPVSDGEVAAVIR